MGEKSWWGTESNRNTVVGLVALGMLMGGLATVAVRSYLNDPMRGAEERWQQHYLEAYDKVSVGDKRAVLFDVGLAPIAEGSIRDFLVTDPKRPAEVLRYDTKAFTIRIFLSCEGVILIKELEWKGPWKKGGMGEKAFSGILLICFFTGIIQGILEERNKNR